MNQAKSPKLAFSMVDAMESLSVSRPTLYKLINTNRLRTYRIGKRRYCTQDALVECQRGFEKDSVA